MGKFNRKLQKVDHGGSYIMAPRRVTAHHTWRLTSYRARAIYIAFLGAFNGTNNGEIEFSIKAIGKAIGSDNHGLNARAVAELCEKGLIECTSEANRANSKARKYRITCISTYRRTPNGEVIEPATHDYEAWQPVKKRKFRGGEITPTEGEKTTFPTTTVKNCGVEITPCSAQKPQKTVSPVGVEITPILYTSPAVSRGATVSRLRLPEPGSAESSLVDPETLRAWARQAVSAAGYGGNNRLAADAGMSAVELSRFRNGKPLPAKHHAKLQAACARILRFDRLRA
jgi:hypothetical protein